MGKFFNEGTFYFPKDGPADNGCLGHVSDLTAAYKEAAVLADDAINALRDLARPRPDPVIQPMEARRWVAKAEAITSFFGIAMDYINGGPEAKSKGDWDNVEELFSRIKYGFDNDKPLAQTPVLTPALYCGTQAWKYIAPNQPDPNHAGKLLKDWKITSAGKLQEKFPNGVWHFNKHYKWTSKLLPTPGGHGLCNPRSRLLAVTSPGLGVVTWCEEAWQQGFKATLPATVAAGSDVLRDTKATTHSKTFLHELVHLHGGRPGIGLGLGPGSHPKVIDQLVSNPLNPLKPLAAYGAANVIKLVQDKGSSSATHNADSYATFAIAMHFADFNWSSGTAKAL